MCWSSRYSGSEIIGVSCKDELMWVNTIGGVHKHSSPRASVPNEQNWAGQTPEGLMSPPGSASDDVWSSAVEGHTLLESPPSRSQHSRRNATNQTLMG